MLHFRTNVCLTSVELLGFHASTIRRRICLLSCRICKVSSLRCDYHLVLNGSNSFDLNFDNVIILQPVSWLQEGGDSAIKWSVISPTLMKSELLTLECRS